MKKIQLPSGISLIGDTEEKPLEKEAEIFDHNKIQILNCFSSIENYINWLIETDLLGKYTEETKELHEKFRSKILCTSWFNFNEKRKLATEILKTMTESKSDQERIEKLFRQVMMYRNAFSHGEFRTDGVISEIEYYEGALKTLKLNEENLNKIHLCFSETYKLLSKTLVRLDIIKESKK